MAKSISKKALTAIAAALLACMVGMMVLVPKNAHAVEPNDALAAAQMADTSSVAQAAPAKQASAKKTVYVRKSMGEAKYSYNKYGLVTKILNGEFQWKFKYNGKKLTKATYYRKSIVDGKWREEFSYSFKYDSKNRIKKMVAVSEGMPNDFYNKTETYTYNKKNQVTKKVETYPSGSPKTTTKYSYNSKGLVKKISSPTATETLKYDSKGNKTSWSLVGKTTSVYDRVTKYKYAYSNGRISKVTQINEGYDFVQAIKYTKKSVPKKYVSAVKAQQTTLNRLFPDAFAPSVFSFKQL